MVGVLDHLMLAALEPPEELLEFGVGERHMRRAERRYDLNARTLDSGAAEHPDGRPRSEALSAERVNLVGVASDKAGKPVSVPVGNAAGTGGRRPRGLTSGRRREQPGPRRRGSPCAGSSVTASAVTAEV